MKRGILSFLIFKANLFQFDTDDVCYQIWTRGIFAFRKDGRNGRGATRKRSIEETNQRGEIRGWTVKKIHVLCGIVQYPANTSTQFTCSKHNTT